MSDIPVIDPTMTPAWDKLDQLADTFEPDLRKMFADDPERTKKFTFQAADLHVDLSKNLVCPTLVGHLLALAEQTGVADLRNRMFAGEHINVTEDRAVLHTALRRPATDSLTVDGQDAIADVHEVLEKVYAFARRVRSGEWVGITGKPVKTVVNVGIGGSGSRPRHGVRGPEALRAGGPGVPLHLQHRPHRCGRDHEGPGPRDDPRDRRVQDLHDTRDHHEREVVRAWLLDALRERGIVTDEASEKDAIAKHFVAVSTALDKVAEFGIDPDNALGFWSWVGGRYSVDSAVGTSLAVAIGPEGFADFLAGFNAMDRHFVEAAPEKNVPLLMGLLNVWYSNFLGADTHAVLPYSQYLHRFPAYLQQLTMESNGKSVRRDGSPVTYETGEVFWGEPGTNGQHAFYQLIHQGTRMVPADFIAFANPTWALGDGDADMHELFLSNFFAQTKALAFGKTSEEVRAEGTPEAIVSARVFTGNRPTTSIMAPALTPSVLGQLIALYEHITFVEGAVWGIDSFDQWGVELGKVLAKQILPAIEGSSEALDAQDQSTRALIEYYRANRSK